MASQQEFADWRRHPVTQEVIQYLEEKKTSLIETMINREWQTVEEYGIAQIAYRNQINGLGEFLDLDYLQEVLKDAIPN
jgi:hypothetical protein